MSFLAGGARTYVANVEAEKTAERELNIWDAKFTKQQDAIDNRTRGNKRRDDDEKATLLAEQLTVLFGNKQHYNPTEAVKYTNAANFALGKIEEEAKKDPSVKNPYAKVSMTTYITNARRKAREDQQFVMGLEDRIEERLYGVTCFSTSHF